MKITPMKLGKTAMLGLALVAGAYAQPSAAQSINVPLISQTVAERHGLTRAWYAQVPLDTARAKVYRITLQADLLMIVTDEAMLYVYNPETGLLLWSYQVGDPKFITSAAGANERNVAVINATYLHMLDRSGGLLWKRELTGVQSRGPILTEKNVAIPMALGPIEVYKIEESPEKAQYPEYLNSAGRVIGEPIAHGVTIAWSGDENKLRGHQFADLGKDFTVSIPGLSTGPAAFAPNVYVGTEAGYLIAYDAQRGEKLWEFGTGSPIHQRPMPFGPTVYVLPWDGGMHCLRSDSGLQQWFSPEPRAFVGASPQRAYTLDQFGRLAMIDAKTGIAADYMALSPDLKPLANNATDRMYFYTERGLIQCLHEVQIIQPVVYAPPKAPAKRVPAASPKAPAAAPAEAPPADAPPA